jgi:two-component sensor histidine kinase
MKVAAEGGKILCEEEKKEDKSCRTAKKKNRLEGLKVYVVHHREKNNLQRIGSARRRR